MDIAWYNPFNLQSTSILSSHLSTPWWRPTWRYHELRVSRTQAIQAFSPTFVRLAPSRTGVWTMERKPKEVTRMSKHGDVGLWMEDIHDILRDLRWRTSKNCVDSLFSDPGWNSCPKNPLSLVIQRILWAIPCLNDNMKPRPCQNTRRRWTGLLEFHHFNQGRTCM